MHRVEDHRLLTGRGRFSDDVAAPGALWAVFVRSPHAHAELGPIRTERAMAVPGARLVLTAADLEREGVSAIAAARRLTDADGNPPKEAPWPVLALRRVRHAGECVAMCVADTAAAALEMAEAVEVDYTPLPVVVDVMAAQRPDAPQLWSTAPGNVTFRWTTGDAAAVRSAFQSASHVVEAEVTNQRVVVCPMEPRAAVAHYDAAASTYHLHTGNQGMTILRDQLAGLMGIDKDAIIVTSHDVGGAFGIKNGTYPEYPTLLVAARLLGQPVRWNATRSESFVSDAQARDTHMRGRLALDAGGHILALEMRASAAMGGYMHPLGYFIACANFSRCLTGPYRIPAIHSEVTCVLTNTVPTAPYRGAGRPEAAYIVETLMERAARQLGIDKVELRRRNMLTPADMPHTTALGMRYDSGDFPALLDAALEASDWGGAEGRRRSATARGRLYGIGLGQFVEISGGAPTERAQMRLGSDGRVHVRTPIGASGQGHQTVFALLAAEQLGVPASAIVVEEGDSRGFADGGSSTASRSTVMAGTAIHATARSFIAAARIRAGELLQQPADALVYDAGAFKHPAGASISLVQIAAAGGTGITAEENITADPVWPSGCHIAEVEIDPETGALDLLRYVAVDDCGRVIAHHFAEAQVHGALAQGIGQALMEHGVYDPASGQLLSGSFMDYAMPRADDLPFFDSALIEVPATSNPLGVKGVGESGTTGALPAMANAIRDALAPLGVTEMPFPATPYRIWQTIKDATR